MSEYPEAFYTLTDDEITAMGSREMRNHLRDLPYEPGRVAVAQVALSDEILTDDRALPTISAMMSVLNDVYAEADREPKRTHNYGTLYLYAWAEEDELRNQLRYYARRARAEVEKEAEEERAEAKAETERAL
jgi:hypothetical protein